MGKRKGHSGVVDRADRGAGDDLVRIGRDRDRTFAINERDLGVPISRRPDAPMEHTIIVVLVPASSTVGLALPHHREGFLAIQCSRLLGKGAIEQHCEARMEVQRVYDAALARGAGTREETHRRDLELERQRERGVVQFEGPLAGICEHPALRI